MENIGNVLKKIRLHKNITQKELASNIMSAQQISNLENDRSKTSIENLIEILRKLNISPGEFYKYIDKDDSQTSFLTELSKSVHNEDLFMINRLIEKYIFLEQTSNNIAYKHNLILLFHFKYRFSKDFIIESQYSLEILIDYLQSVDPWNLYEINLFLNATPFINEETIFFLRNHFLSSMSTNRDFFNPLKTQVYANQLSTSIQILLENGSFDNAHELLLLLEVLADDLNDYYVTFQMIFFKGIYQIKTGNIDEGKQIAEKVIQIFYDLGKESLGVRYFHYLNNNVLKRR